MSPAAVFLIFGLRDIGAFSVAAARAFYGLGGTFDYLQLDDLHSAHLSMDWRGSLAFRTGRQHFSANASPVPSQAPHFGGFIPQ
jgi:hypothetical protein